LSKRGHMVSDKIKISICRHFLYWLAKVLLTAGKIDGCYFARGLLNYQSSKFDCLWIIDIK